MANAKLIDIAALHPISVIQPDNAKNTVSGKAVAKYVKESGGGGDIDLDNIKCNTIEISGDRIEWTDNTNNNIDLGNTANIVNGNINGNINLAYNSTITGGKQYGNVTLGSTSKFEGGEQYGNIISGAESILGEDNHITYGNVILGQRSNIADNAEHYGNVLLGDESTISGSDFYGNVIFGSNSAIENHVSYNIIAGNNFDIGENCTQTCNTAIIGSLKNPSVINKITDRTGLILVGNAKTGTKYQVYWPNDETYAAEIHGWQNWKNDYNVKDSTGKVIIENGVLLNHGGGGSDIDLDNITTRSVEITGTKNITDDATWNDFILGVGSNISGSRHLGNIIAGEESDMQTPQINGNILFGFGSSMSAGAVIQGNALLGNQSRIKQGYSIQYGNIITGSESKVEGGVYYGTVILGSGSTFNEEVGSNGNLIFGWSGNVKNSQLITGNLIAGTNFNVEGSVQNSTWIIADLGGDKTIDKIISDQRGLILIGNGGTTSKPYSLYYPNSNDWAAKQHGYLKCDIDFNLLNSDGEYIIQSGKLIEPSLPTDITCDTLNVNGSYGSLNANINFLGNITQGEQSTVTNGSFYGNITLGYSPIIDGGAFYGILNVGQYAKVRTNPAINGIGNFGSNTSFSQESETYGQINSGSYSYFNAGIYRGNVTTGSNSSIGIRANIYGNMLTGDDFNIDSAATQRNTWIVASQRNNETPFWQSKRYGLTLIGTGGNTPAADNNYRYRVYWPDSTNYAAEQHGFVKCMSDYNLLDSDGKYIIQNGKLNTAIATLSAPVTAIDDDSVQLTAAEIKKLKTFLATIED